MYIVAFAKKNQMATPSNKRPQGLSPVAFAQRAYIIDPLLQAIVFGVIP